MAWLHAVIDLPAHRHDAAAAFWGSALGWRVGVPCTGHDELCSFEPPHGMPYVHLQRIDGPPRVHLDVESADAEETVQRAIDHGAELIAQHDRWRTLRSPGGLPFCVLQAREHQPPQPVTWPDGHRARMVQVCIDSPQPVHEREVAFWVSLLPGKWFGSDAPEFAGKWYDDDGSPLQLLFQRLDETEGAVRAHLDHGTDDLPAEVRRHLALGAADLAPGRGWHVLRSPDGLVFCVTENSPEQTRHRDLG